MHILFMLKVGIIEGHLAAEHWPRNLLTIIEANRGQVVPPESWTQKIQKLR